MPGRGHPAAAAAGARPRLLRRPTRLHVGSGAFGGACRRSSAEHDPVAVRDTGRSPFGTPAASPFGTPRRRPGPRQPVASRSGRPQDRLEDRGRGRSRSSSWQVWCSVGGSAGSSSSPTRWHPDTLDGDAAGGRRLRRGDQGRSGRPVRRALVGSAAKVALYSDGQGTGYMLFAVRGGSESAGSGSGDDPFAGWTKSEQDGTALLQQAGSGRGRRGRDDVHERLLAPSGHRAGDGAHSAGPRDRRAGDRRGVGRAVRRPWAGRAYGRARRTSRGAPAWAPRAARASG